ncbi:RNA-guided endonuclease InsQ/TnpB family protein [Nocardiopsis changdeensis]|uniref:Transposase n=1 Tax=Nocardiopsis changdeensis TaxID=2831969 RepID=A0ABX8BQE3_9ACTN|nr:MULTISPECIES: RNA-guided endonuclease TnpB family protein [Nocardiopsis]QUX24296.1 transposase [Nocardiopsis changdeensis]QYX34688.1 transposase [Nocardiopsis sp. MT53]
MQPVSTITVQVKLTPSPEQAAALAATLHAVNTQANRVSQVAFDTGTTRNFPLRKLVYADVRAAGIGSQAAQHLIKKVADAYTSLATGIRNGDHGRPGSKRRRGAGSKPIVFRSDAAQPYDARNLSFAPDARTISLWTVRGRLKGVPFTCSPAQAKALAEHKRGEADLVARDGTWYLLVSVTVPDAPEYEPDGFLGVDLGIVNIATTSDGHIMAGRTLNRYRRRRLRLRAKLQAKGTKSAKRLLKKQRRKESRHTRDTNHVIAKRIVAEAERTGRGISLEDLTGIHARVRHRKPQRAALHSWSFRQLGDFITYKAKRAGVPVVSVDAAYSSRECAHCSHTHRHNRISQARFICRSCGVVAHADRNASRVLARRGQDAWNAGRESRVPTAP